MTEVKRFGMWARDFMQPGQFYDYIPYDFAGTDRALLAEFDTWRAANPDVKTLSVTGPLRERRSRTYWVELTVLYER